MHLKSIELSGFKSFAKKSVFEFRKPITAIVGPNGSGKSNVTEAFRFALGEQSIKSMRGQRGEDLIWTGSPELPRSSKASVSVLFDNKKRILNIDFDEASVERVVYRDGVNEYLLNGSRVRLKDVVEVLSPSNIGPSGHHIISQGEADKILNAGINERRGIIEDALGLRIYQYKKQESQRKLLKTEENILQVNSLQKELSPHIRFLKKQHEKFQKTKEMRDALSGLFVKYYAAQRKHLEDEKQKIKENKKEPVRKLDELQNQLIKASADLKQVATDEKREKLLELETRQNRLRKEKDDLTRNLGRIEGQILSLQTLENRSKEAEFEKISIERTELQKIRGEILNLSKEASASQDIGLVKSLFTKAIEKLEVLFGGNKPDRLDRNIEAELQKLEAEKERFQTNLNKLADEENSVEQSFKELQTEIEREKDQNQELEKNIFKMRAEDTELHSLISSLNEAERRVKIEDDVFKSENREAKVLIGEALFDSLIAGYEEDFILPDEERFALRREIEKIKIRLEDSGTIGEEIEKEYLEITERSSFLERELQDLQKSAASLKQLIKNLDQELSENFKSGIQKINQKFNSLFSIMFDGGSASLILVKDQKRKIKEDDILEDDMQMSNVSYTQSSGEPVDEVPEGLDIKISLPRKKIRSLEMLSGGERALTSIALIFAISQVNPPPFLVLDETDAALDESNSRRYGEMLQILSESSQLILITHNRETMSRAGVIYGITMGKEGYSRILSIGFEEAVTVAK